MLVTGSRTDVGLKRQANEDYIGVYRHPVFDMVLAAVADGMGGHRGGKIASSLMVTKVYAQVMQWQPNAHTASDHRWHYWEQQLQNTIRKVHEQLYAFANGMKSLHGMGTTLTVAWTDETRICLAHTGDSRAYLWSGDRCVQLTEDHTIVNEMVKQGKLSKHEAHFHQDRHILTQALCTSDFTLVETQTCAWSPGDRLLLCSDGLSSMLFDEQIESVLRTEQSTQKCVERLVDMANGAGGMDNISVVVIDNV